MRGLNSYLTAVLAVFIISGCATTLPPAGPSETLMEKADAIYVATEDEPEEAYKKIAQLLTDNGYSIASSDAMLMNITTEYQEYDQTFGEQMYNLNSAVSINASVREESETVVKLTAKYRTSEQADVEVNNFGRPNSITNRGWENLMKIAESYPGGKLTFTRNQ